jgi:hypothetical protein
MILYNDSEIVVSNAKYLEIDIINELKEINEESWPPPNLFIDELL